jgi:hypothetical protein
MSVTGPAVEPPSTRHISLTACRNAGTRHTDVGFRIPSYRCERVHAGRGRAWYDECSLVWRGRRL